MSIQPSSTPESGTSLPWVSLFPESELTASSSNSTDPKDSPNQESSSRQKKGHQSGRTWWPSIPMSGIILM